jgi:hypothetical protein
MSVEHYLLSISDEALTSILAVPEVIHEVVDKQEDEVCRLFENAPAIMFLTAADADDPLLFLEQGAPPGMSGWVGEYVVEDDRVVSCEVDMGYGPATYFRKEYVAVVARRLNEWTMEQFAERFDPDVLEEHYVYPLGWRDPGRREDLIQSFSDLREYVMAAADSGKHLLAWNA